MTLAYFAGAWFAGTVAVALGWDGRTAVGAALASAAIAVAAGVVRRRPRLLLVSAICVALFAGGFLRARNDISAPPPSTVIALNDGPAVTFRALVVDEPDTSGAYVSTRLAVREVQQRDGSWEQASGGVLLREVASTGHHYGDLLTVTAKLETPASSPAFDYRQYLANRGIDSVAYYPEVILTASDRGNAALNLLHKARSALDSAMAKALPEPQASLAQGIVLGERSALPQELKDDLNATSTSHIIALSGYNVTVLAGLVIGALAWLIGRRRAALLALALIVGYTLFTGASPSLVRAAIMGCLYLGAIMLGRPTSGIVSIMFAAALMAGLQPNVVTDISFQLSFAATAGLIVLERPLRWRVEQIWQGVGWLPPVPRQGVAAGLYETALITFCAVIATLPLIALYFQRVSLIALPANLLVLPAFPYIILSSTLVGLLGLFSAPLAQFAGYFAGIGLSYMVAMVRVLAAVPFASLEIRRFNLEMCVASYAFLASLVWLLGRQRPGEDALRRFWEPLRRVLAVSMRPLEAVPSTWLAGGLALTVVIAWAPVLSSSDNRLTGMLAPPEGRLTVEVFDVGQGDSILVTTPGGKRLLVDGGPDADVLEQELGEALPFWDQKLDMVLLTHPDSDHLTGLVDVIQRHAVGHVVSSPNEAETQLAKTWRETIAEKELLYDELTAGAWIDLGEGASLQVLGPPKEPIGGSGAAEDRNNNSLVLMLRWGSISFLLTGDLETDGEKALLDEHADLAATVLKVAHHGSAYGTSAALLAAVRPSISVISVGENDFGQPAPSTLQRLENTVLCRADEEGDVTFSTDGERLWLKTERGDCQIPSRFSDSG
jgi:competence protein ComEC